MVSQVVFIPAPIFMTHLGYPEWNRSSSKYPHPSLPALPLQAQFKHLFTSSTLPLYPVWTLRVLELSSSSGRAKLKVLQGCNSTHGPVVSADRCSGYTIHHLCTSASSLCAERDLRSRKGLDEGRLEQEGVCQRIMSEM